MSHDTALLLSGLNGVAYFLSALVPIPLIERVGRRKLMIFSAAGQAITISILAAMTQDVGNKAKGYVAAVMLFVFNFFFVREHDWLLFATSNETLTFSRSAIVLRLPLHPVALPGRDQPPRRPSAERRPRNDD